MSAWIGLAVNGIFGLPLALVAWSIARETARAFVALAFGFRVFEIQLGTGRPRIERPVGPIDLALAPLPLGGSSRLRSGSPRHHRARRIACATAPILLHLVWLTARALQGESPLDGLPREPFSLRIFDLAGAALLAFHLLLPVELYGTLRTDSRLLLDALLARTDSSRADRASYYARLARHHLERARVDAARAAIEQALVQLGPVPLLAACREQLDANELKSVVDQGACADALRRLIEQAEPSRAVERRDWTLRERCRQALASALPLTILLGGVGLVEADRVMTHLEDRLLERSSEAALAGDPEPCTERIAGWSRWSKLDRFRGIGAAARRDRHARIAGLEACRGDWSAAAIQHEAARRAADAAAPKLVARLASDPAPWVENELVVLRVLQDQARGAHARRAHREALVTLRRAEVRAQNATARLRALPNPPREAGTGIQALEAMLAEIRSLRARLLEAGPSTAVRR